MRRATTAIVPATLLLLGLSTPLPLDLAASPTRLDLDRVLPDAPAVPSAVLLVALDGVRPTEIFQGTEPGRGVEERSADDLTPNLHRMMSRGLVLGDPDGESSIVASGPNFMSLPGYTEMFTGAPAPCQQNDCTVRPNTTLVDLFRGAGAAHDDVAVITSWPRIAHVAASAEQLAFVSAGREHVEPLETAEGREAVAAALRRGAEAGPEPGVDDYRPDANTMEVALAYTAERRPDFLFVSLGDTDEHAHEGDYAAYLEALRDDDAFVGELVARADAWSRDGHPTVVIVTTDHGRAADFFNHGADYPDSAPVWLVAAGPGVPPHRESESGPPLRATLSDVARMVTRFADLRR